MLIQPIDYFLVVWFALAAASTAYVAWDQYRNNPEPAVMKWGFILVPLYMGPTWSRASFSSGASCRSA
jgi:manganese oxidase